MKQRLDQPTASVQLIDYYSSENLCIPCRMFKTNNHFNVYYGIDYRGRMAITQNSTLSFLFPYPQKPRK